MEDAVARLRVDARENRQRIVAAARALFAERGLDVGMKEVARRAGVGPATLYRRFPTSQALVETAFAVEMSACRAVVLQGAADPLAWRGLSSTLRRLVALSAGNRIFVDAVEATGGAPAGLAEHRRELLAALDGLVRRARLEGVVRPDLAIDDLLLMLQAGRALPRASDRGGRPPAERFADLAIAALRPNAQPGRRLR